MQWKLLISEFGFIFGDSYDIKNNVQAKAFPVITDQELHKSKLSGDININPTLDNRPRLEAFRNILHSTETLELRSWGEIRARQSSLLQTKYERCQSAGPWPSLDPYSIRTLLVDTLHKAAFCAVPKAGSTSWTSTLLTLVGREDQVARTPHKDFLKSNKSALTYIHNFNPKQSQRILQDYYLFTFVRDPWERLLSAYYYMVGNSSRHQFYSKHQPTFLKHFPANEINKGISFSEFLRFIGSSTTGLAAANIHWKPIYLVNH